MARANARELRLEVDFLRGDWCAPLGDASVDVLVANPPYVAEGDPHLAELAAEPLAALVSGPEGLDALRSIIGQSPRVLRAGGWLMLEHGFDQGGAVRTLLAEAGFSEVTSARDLGGHERVSLGRRP